MLQAQHVQHAAEFPPETDVPKLLVIDRSVDWVTPMLFPLTYESLIDEVYGIKGGTCLIYDICILQFKNEFWLQI